MRTVLARRRRSCIVFLLSAALALIFSVHDTRAADGPSPALRLTVAGPVVQVFSRSRDGCDPLDIPDAPARAIRVASGGVQLYAPHFQNRRLVGPDLWHLKEDCRVVFRGNERDDPAAFDDRAWLTSLYTPDGHTIYAAVHNEFQGHRRKALCPSGRYIDCWYNAVTAAVSTDAGQSFHRVAANKGLVATLPYRYDETVGQHRGYFNPSNIVEMNGRLFMMVFATAAGAQLPGNCLLRTERIADPAAWRAWDGATFGASFVDPYLSGVSTVRHTCMPVGRTRLHWPVTSLIRHAPSGLFIALMMNAGRDGGVFYATSPNLIDWSAPARLLSGSGESAYTCGDPPPLAFPSLLDPASTDRNFMTVGDSALLFLTQFNVSDCKTSLERELVRWTVTIVPQR